MPGSYPAKARSWRVARSRSAGRRMQGGSICLPLVITRDPDTGARNVGCYRMQVIDGRRAS